MPDLAVLASALHPSRSAGVTNNCDADTGRPGPVSAEVTASIVQVELVSAPERIAHVTAAVAAERAPDDDLDAVVVPLTLAGLHHVQDHPDDLDLFIRAATDFRAFLDLWQFRAQEVGAIRVLGNVMWEAQEEFVRMTRDQRDEYTGKNWVYFLKARKLGRNDNRLRVRRLGAALP